MFRQWISRGLWIAAVLAPIQALASDDQSTIRGRSDEVAAATSEWDELVAAARKEGKVELILSGQVPMRLRKAMPDFEKKYGVRVNFQTGGGSAHGERILAERRVGRYTVDVWLGGQNTPLVYLLPNKALMSFPELIVDPDVKDPSRWFRGRHHYTDEEGRYIFTWGAAPSHTVAYNTKLVDPSEIKSYADLLNPKWKGKIVSWSPAAQSTAASSVPLYLNPKVGETWFHRWASEMDVTIVSDARQGAEWVALGRFAIGMFGLNTQAEDLKDQGFPIKDYLPHPMAEGEVLSASAANLMVVDRAPNFNAAKLFVNWALSREAQAAFIKIAEKTDTLRTDVPNDVIEPQYRIDPKADYFVAFADAEYIERKTEITGKLKKIMQDAGFR